MAKAKAKKAAPKAKMMMPGMPIMKGSMPMPGMPKKSMKGKKKGK